MTITTKAYALPLRVLFVCTHNRCRSILSEAIARYVSAKGNGSLQVASAGSHPEGKVHQGALKELQSREIDIQGLKSQSWNEFDDDDIDVVITVCDQAHGEVCPLYLGKALKVHWGLPDPSKLAEADQAEAFAKVIEVLTARINHVDQELASYSAEELNSQVIKSLLQATEEQFSLTF